MAASTEEQRSLGIVVDCGNELHSARASLAGKTQKAAGDKYIFHLAAQVEGWTIGYAHLRMNGLTDASKCFVRPALEAVIRMLAVAQDRGLLVRIAFGELEEDRKLVRAMNVPDVPRLLRRLDEHWREYKRLYFSHYPKGPFDEKQITVRELAKRAKLEDVVYDLYYRFYCRSTHATLRAATGMMKFFDKEDNPTMALVALMGIQALVSIGATAPRLAELTERLRPARQNSSPVPEKT
jgi:hypothetical protein